jgi:tight adherence protein B
MSFIFANDFIFIGIFSALVTLITYLNADKTIDVLQKKSLQSRDEILRLLELMFVETDKKKITQLLLLVSFGLGFALFLLLWPNFWLGLTVASIITVVMWKIPLFLVKNMYEKRCSLLVTQMVDGLTIMANGIKAGLGVTQSMERVVENMSNPISQEFSLVLSQIRLGRSVEEALIEFGERIPRPDVQMFVTAINILKETGGNLAETFSTIVVTIRERQKIEKKIEAMTAQGLMQGLIVSMIPFLLIGLFFFVDKPTIMPLFTHPLGLVILLIIIGLVVIGGVVVRKVVKIEV